MRPSRSDGLDWHAHVSAFLDGSQAPRQRPGLRLDVGDARDSAPGVEVRMWVVMKDGNYQAPCKPCVAKYLPKRKDLFQGTQFGSEVLKL